MNTPVSNTRSRLLVALAAILTCGAFTACDDDYHHHPSHTYHGYRRTYHRDYDRDDDYRYNRSYRRDGYYGSSYYGPGYRRSYYAPGVTVHRGPVRTRAVVYY